MQFLEMIGSPVTRSKNDKRLSQVNAKICFHVVFIFKGIGNLLKSIVYMKEVLGCLFYSFLLGTCCENANGSITGKNIF